MRADYILLSALQQDAESTRRRRGQIVAMSRLWCDGDMSRTGVRSRGRPGLAEEITSREIVA